MVLCCTATLASEGFVGVVIHGPHCKIESYLDKFVAQVSQAFNFSSPLLFSSHLNYLLRATQLFCVRLLIILILPPLHSMEIASLKITFT